jgi:hypothetical protein
MPIIFIKFTGAVICLRGLNTDVIKCLLNPFFFEIPLWEMNASRPMMANEAINKLVNIYTGFQLLIKMKLKLTTNYFISG